MLRGPFEVLFRTFSEKYIEASEDEEVLETSAPFFAFRGLVIASPLWFPGLSVDVRRKIFHFVENILAVERFDPGEINRYCRK
jgi:hypothetical protein